MASGLTPGVKTSNRTLEIIENIAQKSLNRRWCYYQQGMKLLGQSRRQNCKRRMLDQYKVAADAAEVR
jgi:hypothetical protein